MEVIILHQTVKEEDAIGHDVLGMYNALVKQNIKVYIFAEYNLLSNNYEAIGMSELKRKSAVSSNILIYHHSVYWKLGEEITSNSNARIIIKYHNITPSSFFKDYSESYYNITHAGRLQTRRFANKRDYFWVCDSEYNRQEIVDCHVPTSMTEIVAPFHKIEHFKNIEYDSQLYNQLSHSNNINVIFIGRVVTNKGHMRICQVAKAFKEMYTDSIKFWIIGGFDQELSKYIEELKSYIYKWKIENMIEFTDKVSSEKLKSFIKGSDLFLCLSEHEGFCVPLIESQYYGLPIVAVKSSAITETLGSNQIVFSEFDEELIASAIKEVTGDTRIKSYLIDQGKNNFNSRFKHELIEAQFIDVIKRFLD